MFSPESHPNGFPVYGDMPQGAMVSLMGNSVIVFNTESYTLSFDVFGPFTSRENAAEVACQIIESLGHNG